MSAGLSARAAADPAPPAAPMAGRPAMVKSLCHDCRTPLAVIAEFASIVRDELHPEASAETAEFLELIADRVLEIEGLLAEYEHLGRLDAAGAPPVAGQSRLADLLGDVAPRLRSIAGEASGAVEVQARPAGTVWCDPNDIARALAIVVTDFCRTTPGHADIRLSAGPDVSGHAARITLAVGGTGAPIDDAGEVPARQTRLNFRLQVAAAMVERNAGLLTAGTGEPRSLSFLLPTAPGRALRLPLFTSELRAEP